VHHCGIDATTGLIKNLHGQPSMLCVVALAIGTDRGGVSFSLPTPMNRPLSKVIVVMFIRFIFTDHRYPDGLQHEPATPANY
jgi:hypothetical protein